MIASNIVLTDDDAGITGIYEKNSGKRRIYGT